MYWLGRYTERVYTTLKAFYDYYDKMIDRDPDIYQKLCTRLDIPNIYQGADDFIHNFLFDQNNPDSVYLSLNRAMDNGIMLRNEITSESLAYIQLALDMYGASSTSDVPTMALLPVQDYLLAFWGSLDDNASSQRCRDIIKCGKYIERLDLYYRLYYPADKIEKELCKLLNRLPRTGMAYQEDLLEELLAVCRDPERPKGWRMQCAYQLYNLIS
ncbi:MAG: alpha-E domain-containing protein [Butyricicoccaceae bacterium]